MGGARTDDDGRRVDAGAGADWTYLDQETGLCLGRSEGLALASLRLFEAGTLSADPEDPLRADATALKALTAEQLGDAFQAGPDNPLVGLAQRAGLLQRLGSAVEDQRKNKNLALEREKF